MSSHAQHSDSQAGPAVDGCALGEGGTRAQVARYARLSPSVALVRRSRAGLLVRFEADFDRELLEHALAIERECCPFFDLELSGRELRVTVSDASRVPALDALAQAFAGGGRAGERT